MLLETDVSKWAVVVLGAISITTGLVSQTFKLSCREKAFYAVLAFTSAGTALIVSQF